MPYIIDIDKMKRILIIIIFLIQLHEDCVASNCQDKNEYEDYLACVRSEKCDCDCKVNDCNDICETNCIELFKECTNSPRCCHKTCNLACRSTTCRRSCRQKCEGATDVQQNITILNPPHNVTTILHLHNMMNTTINNNLPELEFKKNIFDLPPERQRESPSQKPINNCCNIVGPTTCQPETPKTNNNGTSTKIPTSNNKICNYNSTYQCGDICVSPTMHREKFNTCSTPTVNIHNPNCQDLFYYVPQPQPRCFPTFTWPYVSCRPYEQQFCGGCYSHYFDQTVSFFKYCPSACYDEGYNDGPLYRLGPFYRPGYSHRPPCFLFGTCGTLNNPYANIFHLLDYITPQ